MTRVSIRSWNGDGSVDRSWTPPDALGDGRGLMHRRLRIATSLARRVALCPNDVETVLRPLFDDLPDDLDLADEAVDLCWAPMRLSPPWRSPARGVAPCLCSAALDGVGSGAARVSTAARRSNADAPRRAAIFSSRGGP